MSCFYLVNYFIVLYFKNFFMKKLIILFFLLPFFAKAQSPPRLPDSLFQNEKYISYRSEEPYFMSTKETAKLFDALGENYDFGKNGVWVYFTANIRHFFPSDKYLYVYTNKCIILSFENQSFDFQNYYKKYFHDYDKPIKIKAMISYKAKGLCPVLKNIEIFDF